MVYSPNLRTLYKTLLSIALFATAVIPAFGQNRGVAALPNEEQTVTVAWRLLSSDPADAAFHVYRKDLYADTGYLRISEEPVRTGTSFVDKDVVNGSSYRYRIHRVDGSKETPSRDSAYVTSTDWHRPYVSIPLDGDHTARMAGLGDLNGDGVLDFVVKHPDFSADPYHRQRYWKRSPEPYKLEAYDGATGLMMWRYNMGWAIETGIWYSPYLVYDIDGDGRAEVYAKAGEGDPRENDGRVITGPEYLVKLDGRTGKIIAKTDWHSREGWAQYSRSQRHMLAVAYLDGKTPSLIMQRGTYDLMKTAALDKRLNRIWNREAHNPHAKKGPGGHGLLTADVDEDGKDELILGATALDEDGSVLWETGLGHPDVCHVADILPNRPGLEIFLGIEPGRTSKGVGLISARDGQFIWHYDGPTNHVHSKGMIGDIDASHPGMECYAGEQNASQYWLYAADGTRLSDKSFGTLAPMAVWWDADPQKEMIVDNRLFNYPDDKIMEIEGKVLAVVDCLGDWREEIITSLPGELRIYSSTLPSESRHTWLMEDRQYRLGVATSTMGYFREPQLSTGLK